MKPFLAPLFIAIAGSSSSISVMDSMALIGADMSRARLRYAIELLGGIGKKKLKKWKRPTAIRLDPVSMIRLDLTPDPYHATSKFGAIAQLGERNTGSVEVSGSIRLAPPKSKPPHPI